MATDRDDGTLSAWLFLLGERRRFARTERGPVQKTLSVVTSEREQRRSLFLVLDSLRSDLQFEAVRQTDHTTNQRRRLGVKHNRANESAVDLERVDLELPQVMQARGASTKVIERNKGAPASQRGQCLLSAVQVLKQSCFRHFDIDPLRREPALLQDEQEAQGPGL